MPPVPHPFPADAYRLARRQTGLITVRQAVGTGLHRNRLAASARLGLLRHVVRGVYELPDAVAIPAGHTGRSEQLDLRRRRAAILGLLAYGEKAVSTGLCALVLAGARGAPADLVPEVTLRQGDPRRPIPGIRVRRVPVQEWTIVDGFPIVPPEHALAQVVPEVDRKTAICLMDSALNRGLIDEGDLRRAHDLTRGHPGVARTHGWWADADGRAESPAETTARLDCADAGYPPDVLQLRVISGAGRFLARVELAWLLPDGRWLLVEVDGVDVHGRASAMVADLHRQNPLITSATVLRRYTGADAMTGRLATEVVPILRANGWRPGGSTSPGPLVLRSAA